MALRFLCLSEISPKFEKTLRAVCTNVDQTLIADQRKFNAKYLQNDEEQ